MKYIKTFEYKKKKYYTIENELIDAVYNNQYSKVKRLLDSGFDINSTVVGEKNNALLYASYKGYWSILYLLLKYNPDWYVKDDSKTDFIQLIEEHLYGDKVIEKIRKKYSEKYEEYLMKKNIEKFQL